MTSVPLQNNWGFRIGPNNATKYTLNIQLVMPVSISEDYKLIVRTVLPVNELSPAYPDDKRQAGLGDTTQSFFFSPKEPWPDWILGAGPVGLYPTASDPVFGSQQWGAGPTVVALQQKNGFTCGVLANHIWSINGLGWGDHALKRLFHATISRLQHEDFHNADGEHGVHSQLGDAPMARTGACERPSLFCFQNFDFLLIQPFN